MNEDQNQGVGPLVGSIIIVILLLIGGYYSWISSTVPSRIDIAPGVDNSNYQPAPVVSASMKPIQHQQSTEITDIEADTVVADTITIDSGFENLDFLVK